jgi:L-asparaginase
MSVSVMRGGLEESRHQVHVAVARPDGTLVAWAGDPERLTTMRSTAKPLQLQVAIDAGACEGWDDELVAVCCSSHVGLDEHVAAVRRGFEAAALDPELLRNSSGDVEARLRHDCSGNHLGFLAASAARGWPLEGYRAPEHPSQQAALGVVAAAARVPAAEISTCPDGCGVVCFALPLRVAAAIYARLPDEYPRQAAAMRARPEMVRGPGELDTELMRHLPSAVSKGGAEALHCLSLPEQGLGVAVRIDDGGSRAVAPASFDVLRQLLGEQAIPDALEPFRGPPVLDSSGVAIGNLRGHVKLTSRSGSSMEKRDGP